MSKRYSIAEARRNLPSVVDEAEAGSEVELTRRGKPVAVVISVDEYHRLKEQRPSFGEAYAKFREAYPDGALGGELGPEYFRKLRERSEARDVEL
jgi:prevent-host-death family protein